MAATTPAEGPTPAEGTAPTATLEPGDAPTARVGRRWRRILVVVLAVLTCLSILLSTVGVWAHRTLLNTDSWVKAVAPLADDPQITNAVAKEVTTQVMQAIDAEKVAANALPAGATVLAAPLTEAVGQFVQRAVAELLQTDQFKTFWVEANRKVHALAVKVLRGETKGVLTTNGTVQLNLLPLLADAFSFIQARAPGLVGNGTPVPDITFDTPVDQARSELQASASRTLPENFGVVTVFESDQLKAAQDAVSLFDKLVIALLVLTVLLFVATVALALDRRRILIWLGLGTVVAFVLAVAIVRAIRDQVLGLIGDEESRQAAKLTISTLVNSLDVLVYVISAIGLALALIAFLTGSSNLAIKIRASATRNTAYLAGRIDRQAAPQTVRWVQQHTNLLRAAGVVVGLLVLVFVVHGWWGLFLTVLVVGLFEAAVSFAAARGEMPSEPSSPAA